MYTLIHDEDYYVICRTPFSDIITYVMIAVRM